MSHHHQKDLCCTYLLWFFFGIFGVHRFYLGRTCSGVVYLCTAGIFGIGWLVDICLIPGMVEHANLHEEFHHHHHDHHHHHHEPQGYVYQQPVAYVASPQPAYVQPVAYAAPPVAYGAPGYGAPAYSAPPV